MQPFEIFEGLAYMYGYTFSESSTAMKKNKPFLSLILAVFLIVYGCTSSEVTPDNTPNLRSLRSAEKQTVENSTDFAFAVFDKMNNTKSAGENLFISPFSLSTAVAMAYNEANGTTKDGIKKAIRLEGVTDAELNSSYQSLVECLNGVDKTVTFSPANSIWYQETFTPQDDFVKQNQTYFNAEVKGLDMIGNSEGSKNTINAWVKDKTNDKIDKIIDRVLPGQVMFLINAIYFKGTWTYQFNKNQTLPATFYLENGATVTKDFMNGEATVNHLVDADKVLVELPYRNQQFVMTLIMPQPGKPMTTLMSQLTSENFAQWLTTASPGKIQISLPKFSFEGDYTKKEFNKILANLGMNEAFSDNADFSRMLVGFTKGDLKIDEVAHKTFVKVDEEGSEAAAVTSIGIAYTSAGPTSFVFNRPFVYLIREKNSGAILFMGKMMNPTVEK